MKRVEVEWVDSSSCSGGSTWKDTHVVKDDHNTAALTCRSIGYVLHKSKESITLVAHLAAGGKNGDVNQVSGDMTIPCCAIVEIRKLSHKKSVKK